MSAPAPVRPVAPQVWGQVADASTALFCEQLHHRGTGRLDETARRLSHEELEVALLFAAEGHDVRSVPEFRRGGRKPDLLVCGLPVEVKSFAPEADRRRDPTAYSVFNKLTDASGQARHAVLVDAHGGLSESAARRGVARYVAVSSGSRPRDRDRDGPPPLYSARILGNGFDLAWARQPSRQLPSGLWAPPGRRSPGRGLGF